MRQILKNNSGSSMIEVMLLLPVFMTVIIMIFSVGTTLSVKHGTVVSARDIIRFYAAGTNVDSIARDMVGKDTGFFGKISSIQSSQEGNNVKIVLVVEKKGFALHVDEALNKLIGINLEKRFTYTLYFPKEDIET